MAEELYFLKTNPVIARINLYNKLCREEDQIIGFLHDDSRVSLELIKKKVQDSVEHLSKEEFCSIFRWFASMSPSDPEEIKTQLFIHGLDLFYEIPKGTGMQDFLDLLSAYETAAQQPLHFVTDASEFNRFVIYGLFFTDIALQQKGVDAILSHYLKPDYPVLYNLAEEHFRNHTGIASSEPLLQQYFGELYEETKFYKGPVIMVRNI